MTYKVILNHLDSSAATEARTALACQLSNQLAAHLVGLAAAGIPGTLSDLHPNGYKPAPAQVVQQGNLEAQQAVIRFEQQSRQKDIRSFESRRVASRSLDAIKWHERFCDLLLIGRQ